MLFRSHSLTSRVDEFAATNADLLILIGRILLAWIFVGSAYGAITNFSGSVGYFRSLNVPAPQLFTTMTVALEVLMSTALILGIGTRYCAVLFFCLYCWLLRSLIDTGNIPVRSRLGSTIIF